MNKIETRKTAVREFLNASQDNVMKALLALYDHQTPVEQETKEVIVRNLEGFRPCDAVLLSDCAVNYKVSRVVSETVLPTLKEKLSHYFRQLTGYGVVQI